MNSCEELSYLLDHPEANKIFAKVNENEILTYATKFSEFYKKYAGFTSLQDFPIMTKADLKEHWDEIAVPQLADDPKICTKFTSGSTGTPFKMILDKYKHARWIAGNKVFRANVGVKSHEKTAFMSGTVADKNIPQERMDRDNVYYFMMPYLDDAALLKLVRELEEGCYKTLTAMASIYDKLARWIQAGKAPKWGGNLLQCSPYQNP